LRSCNKTILIAKHADINAAKEATYAMNLNSFNRVINSVSLKDLGRCQIDNSSKKANEERRVSIDVIAYSCNHNQAGKRRIHDCDTEMLSALFLSKSVEENVSGKCSHA